MNTPHIDRLLELQRLLIAFSQVERVVHRKRKDNHVTENDTEHSYDLAMMAWFIAQTIPHLDKDKVIRYALVHDLVEVHAGDTYVFDDAKSLASKAQREEDALERLHKEWADFPDMLEAIETYELRQDEESRFVYALDKIMPAITIYLHDGYTWKQEGITPRDIDAIKREKVKVSPEIAKYYDAIYELLTSRSDLFQPR